MAQMSAFASALSLQSLGHGDTNEVLDFLATQTVDAIFMTGLIRDNGIESPLNRGSFYGLRESDGSLAGVALIGHATLVEARTEEALASFARLAQRSPCAHVIVGKQEKIERFWNYYGDRGQRPRQICRELLFEQRSPALMLEPVPGLRRATLADLELIVPVNAALAEAESSVNPLHTDAEGFRNRLRHRIEQGRVWVWTKGGQLIFKVDVMAEVPGVTYLEGVYVHPEERGRGYGSRCLSQLGQLFLSHGQSICLLVNELNKDAQVFFFKVGYKLRGCYDTIFLQPGN